ncbi:MAG: ABC transporter six-transmembrane domain-containing protein [Pseudomonadota bacterium]
MSQAHGHGARPLCMSLARPGGNQRSRLNHSKSRATERSMLLHGVRLSLGSLLRVYWRQVSITWTLTLLETLMMASLPLLIGGAIDGLINDSWRPFFGLAGIMATLLVTGVARRVYDTRAYGAMRVDLGANVVGNARGQSLSATNARLTMSGELIEFLEAEAPMVLTAAVHAIFSIAVLLAFHGVLAAAVGGATILALVIYALFRGRFFHLNAALHSQSEKQVAILESSKSADLLDHLALLRRQRVRLSDLEALVYGLIFAVLLSTLGFNLWFATTQTNASSGDLFAIVVYSYEFIDSAVMFPMAMQSITRIREITDRINSV